jgi:hypothetical protein
METENEDRKEGDPADDRRGPRSRAEWGSGLDVLVLPIITMQSSICPLSARDSCRIANGDRLNPEFAAEQVTRR